MGGQNIEKAQQAAILLNEIFGKRGSDIELFIYGHTADHDNSKTHILVYKDKKINNRFSLGNVKSKANNRDGEAILICAQKIRKQTKRPGVIFVISDGAPYASNYYGKSAIDDTRRKVKRAQKLGFQIIQIAIESHVPSEDMFDMHVKLTNINSLPSDLVSYVSRNMKKLLKTTTKE